MSLSNVMHKRQSTIEATLRGVCEMADMASQNADICEEGRATLRRLHDHITSQLAALDREAAEAALALLSKV